MINIIPNGKLVKITSRDPFYNGRHQKGWFFNVIKRITNTIYFDLEIRYFDTNIGVILENRESLVSKASNGHYKTIDYKVLIKDRYCWLSAYYEDFEEINE